MEENGTEKSVIPAVKPLSGKLKFWFGIGDCSFSLMTNIETYYFNFFLTNVAAFSIGLTAVVSSVYSIVDASLSWIYGGILNRVKPKKWGRYRSWLIMIPWCVPFLYAFQYLSLSSNATLSAVIITAAAIISHVVWNLPYAANATMVSVAGQNTEGRVALASSRATWSNISNVLFSFVGLPLANILAGVVGEKSKFGALAFVLGILMVLGYFVHFRITEGYEEIEVVNTAKESKTKASMKDMAKALFQNPHLICLIIADLAKWIVKFVVAGAAIYYFTYVANNAPLLNTYILVSSLLGVLGAYCARFIAKSFSNKTTMMISYAFMAILMLISYFGYSNITLVLCLMSLVQFGYGCCYACAPALYADTAVYAEWKTKTNSVGWIMGLQNFPLKVGVLLRAAILAACLAAANFSNNIKPAEASLQLKQGITGAFCLLPALFLILGVLLLAFGYRLSKEKIDRYQVEIAARK